MSTIARNKHWINRLPHIYEIDDLLDFCRKNKHVYIYGRGEAQEWLLRFLDMCDIKNIDGYVVSYAPNEENFCYRKLAVKFVDDVMCLSDTGIILALSDRYHGEIVPRFREKGFTNYMSLTEHTRLGIAEQMAPRNKDEMTFEVSLADHCNLSCQMCDHFSQLSESWFVDVEQFKRDISQMGEIFRHEIGAITLLGGEPTLHPNLNELIQASREQFPNAELILLTNGVMLTKLENSPQGNLWEILRECNVHVTVTVYPIKLDYIAIENKAKEYGIALKMSSDIHAAKATQQTKISDKHTMDLRGNVPKSHCVHCLYFNKFNVLKDGKYYMCPVQAHIDIFNRRFKKDLGYIDGDYLDIYEVSDWRQFAEFGSKWVPFCRYCDQKKWGHASEWKASDKRIEEYVD